MATINGTEGNDTLTGTTSNDTINGRGGDDLIRGLDGNDYFSDPFGLNKIYGGGGNDQFYQSHGELYGDAGNDSFTILINETVTSIAADGGAGDDTFIVSEGGTNPNLSICLITGGEGIDTLRLSLGGDSRGAFELLTNSSSIDVLEIVHSINLSGSYALPDSLIADGQTLLIKGEGDFNRTLDFSNETNGTLEVDYRSTMVWGIPISTSVVYGGALSDSYWGNGWADVFKGGSGNDFFDGADGNDVAIFNGLYTNYTITEITYNKFLVTDNVGSDGVDVIVDVNTLQFSDQTVNVVIRGMEIIGDDSAEEIKGGDESDHLDGSGGNDTVDGGLGNDLLEGGLGQDLMVGGGGNDFMTGGLGNDEIIAGAGNDEVDAGDGDDLIVGGDGEGDDTYIGGSGFDTIRYTSALASITVNLQEGRANSSTGGNVANIGTDTLRGIEGIVAGYFNDVLIGDQHDNSFSGEKGDDDIDGGNGSDTSVYKGSYSEYKVVKNTDGSWTITDSVASRDGIDTLRNIENLQFSDSLKNLSTSDAPEKENTNSHRDDQAHTFSVPLEKIDAIGLSPDGRYLIVKANGLSKMVSIDSMLEFTNSSKTASELTNVIKPISVFSSVVNGTTEYVLPELYAGPASLNLKYQLIDSTRNAVLKGSIENDFIKVAHETSDGKAVDAGEGDDVVDGGVGSTFITGGGGSNTFFLDGRAPGVSWSTITDFKLGTDKATIWGWKAGVSRIASMEVSGGAPGYTGLTLHFENLLPDDAAPGQTNPTPNSITLSRLGLSDLGVNSLDELNAQIGSGGGGYFQVGSVSDQYGDHGYLYIS